MPRKNLFDQPPADDPQLPGSIGLTSEKARIDAAKKWFTDALKAQRDRLTPDPAHPWDSSHPPPRRAEQFVPYLLVRSQPGDMGGRPIAPNVTLQSPDIWLVPGDPAQNPISPDPKQTVADPASGKPHTLYAHVWNLGRAPIAGVRVEFYFTRIYDPKTGPFPPVALGYARVDLPPRSSLACHTLVKCPQAVTAEGIADFAAIVRVSSIGDPIPKTHQWDPSWERHVARRLIVAAIA